jgi:hypothetical protein
MLLLVATHRQKGERQLLPWPNLRPTQKRPLLLLVATHRQKGETQRQQGETQRQKRKRHLLLLVAILKNKRATEGDAQAKGGGVYMFVVFK